MLGQTPQDVAECGDSYFEGLISLSINFTEFSIWIPRYLSCLDIGSSFPEEVLSTSALILLEGQVIAFRLQNTTCKYTLVLIQIMSWSLLFLSDWYVVCHMQVRFGSTPTFVVVLLFHDSKCHTTSIRAASETHCYHPSGLSLLNSGLYLKELAYWYTNSSIFVLVEESNLSIASLRLISKDRVQSDLCLEIATSRFIANRPPTSACWYKPKRQNANTCQFPFLILLSSSSLAVILAADCMRINR